MASSGYTPWAVTAGEQPTTAYWNLLGENDASFNSGLGFNDGILLNRHIATNMLSAGLQTYTNGGTSGGTGYFINLGGVKFCWGITGTISVGGGSSNSYTIAWPTSFFSSIQSCTITPTGGTAGANQFVGVVTNGAPIIGSVSFYFISTTGGNQSGTNQASWFVIGT